MHRSGVGPRWVRSTILFPARSAPCFTAIAVHGVADVDIVRSPGPGHVEIVRAGTNTPRFLVQQGVLSVQNLDFALTDRPVPYVRIYLPVLHRLDLHAARNVRLQGFGAQTCGINMHLSSCRCLHVSGDFAASEVKTRGSGALRIEGLRGQELKFFHHVQERSTFKGINDLRTLHAYGKGARSFRELTADIWT